MAVLPSYKEIVELIKKGATLEAQEKLIEYREAIMALHEENLTLKAKIKQLEENLSIKQGLTFDGRSYWLSKENQKDGPYCQVCFDSKSKLIRLQSIETGLWRCFSCKNDFSTDEYKPTYSF
ncbi:MAG: hypothetical protein ABSF52_08605 [Syntrophobacteraceae bacterium]|jgi:hypothetical protein